MTQELPPSASKAGKNRYYHHCDVLGKSQHYGVCQFTIEAVKERGQKLSENRCKTAIENGTCPAMKMQQEEQTAGRALYFKEPEDPSKIISMRTQAQDSKKIDRSHPSYKRGRYGAVWGSQESRKKATSVKSKPAPKKRPSQNDIVEFDGAAAVNAQAQDEYANKPMPGESPLAFARRRKKMQSQGS